MVLMDQDLEEGVSQVTLNVLLSALVLGCLLGVHGLGLVGFKVHFNTVHAVNALLIPWCFFLENWAESVLQFLVLRPVLDELNGGKFREDQDDWEVEFALLINCSACLDGLRDGVDFLA